MRSLSRPDGRRSQPAVRIGINTGVALIGNVGSTERLSYTAIGDVVNVASRLEALGKEYSVEIIVSEATAQRCNSSIRVRPLGASAVRGREKPLQIYELIGVIDGMDMEPLSKDRHEKHIGSKDHSPQSV
jgi:class 3 adenylate cyclase